MFTSKIVIRETPNVPRNPLGGCGVRAFASELPEMRVRNLKSAPIS
jgi:hypothetical protein